MTQDIDGREHVGCDDARVERFTKPHDKGCPWERSAPCTCGAASPSNGRFPEKWEPAALAGIEQCAYCTALRGHGHFDSCPTRRASAPVVQQQGIVNLARQLERELGSAPKRREQVLPCLQPDATDSACKCCQRRFYRDEQSEVLKHD